MDDLISRQAAIDAARKCRVIEVTPAYILIDKSEIMTELMCLPSARPEHQWIPCSERLPEKYIGQWLCCTSDGDVIILPYDTPGDGTKECVFYEWDGDEYFYQIFDVVAWMPLPEPYREEQA